MVFVGISIGHVALILMKCTLLMLSNGYCKFIFTHLGGWLI